MPRDTAADLPSPGRTIDGLMRAAEACDADADADFDFDFDFESIIREYIRENPDAVALPVQP